jgi:hypothetical protein
MKTFTSKSVEKLLQSLNNDPRLQALDDTTILSVEKLLQSLNNDPRLQAVDDTTILSEEQYPAAFYALIMRIKEPITLTTTVGTLNYDDSNTQAHSIPSNMRSQLKEKQVKLRELLQLNPTIDNPLDELTYAHWIHRVTHLPRCSVAPS